MKNITLLIALFFATYSFSQSIIKDSVDTFNRLMFKTVSSVEPADMNIAIRDLMVEQYTKIKTETFDSLLVVLIDTKIKTLELRTFDDTSKKVSKKDLLNAKPKKFKVREDKFNHNIFLTHKNYFLYSYNKFSPYLAFSEGYLYLRNSITFTGKNWLFIYKVQFSIDDEIYSIPFENSDRKVYDNAQVSEKIDIIANKEFIEILQKIINSPNEVKIRFIGTDGVKTTKLVKKQIVAFKETLDYYNRF